MKRREFIIFFAGAAAWPQVARAQNKANKNQDTNDQVGQVATLQGIATVTRGTAARSTLKVSDAIYKKDVLQTDANAAIGVTFDDETTLSLTANARIVVDEFIYEEGGNGNTAAFNIARGTVAFVASLVAKTGDMTISTPTATLGIRGTTGVVDVPDSTAAGAGEAKIKLYPDADGRVGQINVFNRQGERLGALTQGSSAFAIRPGAGRADRRHTLPDSAAGGSARPRRGAAAVRLTQCRASDGDPASAIARAEPPAAQQPATEQSSATRGSPAAESWSGPATKGQSGRAAARRFARETTETQSVRAKEK